MKNPIQMKMMALTLACSLMVLMPRPAHANTWDDLKKSIAVVVAASLSGVKEVAVKFIEEKTKQNIIEGCLAKVVGTKEGFILTSCLGATIVIGGLVCYKLASRIDKVKVGRYRVTVSFTDGSRQEQDIEILEPKSVPMSSLTNVPAPPVCPAGS